MMARTRGLTKTRTRGAARVQKRQPMKPTGKRRGPKSAFTEKQKLASLKRAFTGEYGAVRAEARRIKRSTKLLYAWKNAMKFNPRAKKNRKN